LSKSEFINSANKNDILLFLKSLIFVAATAVSVVGKTFVISNTNGAKQLL
jgi:hypothetical protein